MSEDQILLYCRMKVGLNAAATELLWDQKERWGCACVLSGELRAQQAWAGSRKASLFTSVNWEQNLACSLHQLQAIPVWNTKLWVFHCRIWWQQAEYSSGPWHKSVLTHMVAKLVLACQNQTTYTYTYKTIMAFSF